MASPFLPHRSRDRAQRLANEHRTFERTFFELLGRANSGTWHELDEVWDRFASDVASHFDFEESTIFPAFAERDEASRALVQRLRDEHADFRSGIERLGIQLQFHEVPTAAVRELVEALRGHAEREDASVYAWAVDARGEVDTYAGTES
jgi:hemerythrin